MVEGVLKAVDAKERTLTLEKKTASARCRCGSVFEIPPKDDQMGCDCCGTSALGRRFGDTVKLWRTQIIMVPLVTPVPEPSYRLVQEIQPGQRFSGDRMPDQPQGPERQGSGGIRCQPPQKGNLPASPDMMAGPFSPWVAVEA
jgi:hypothetical protein